MLNRSSKKMMAKFVLASGIFLFAFILPARAEDAEPSVTPYRPTVSNPAQLSQPGWLEVESGGNRTKANDGTWRNNLPYTLKFAFSENFGIVLGGDAYVTQTDLAGGTLSGVGDTLLLLKQRWAVNENSAFGVEYGVKAVTARTGLGSGKTDYIVNGIYSTELNKHTIDLNIGLTELGSIQVNERREQLSWASTWSHPAGEDWTVAAEFSGVARQGTAPTNQFLLATSYAMNRRVVWDAGIASGISRAAPRWGVFFGVSVLAGKLF
jgi:hypothetical protein